MRQFIPGQDFLCGYQIRVQWSDTGEGILTHDKHLLVVSVEATPSGPKISVRSQLHLPARNLMILNAKMQKTKTDKEHLYDA